MKAGNNMAYRALYREWRPKDFSHVVGQKSIIETLRNQVVMQRIAHAYLFCGSRGTGKTSTAKILAKAINCLNPENGDPCGKCENCIRNDQEETLDIIEIDAASNNGVDEMRELRDTVKYPPQFGKYKVYIIDEVHMLSTSAFNALLKTLEEPPAHVVFILATTEPQKLPATILSRCQRFDFGRISVPDITGRLKEAADNTGAQVTDGALMLIARAAEGGMRDALSILDMCLGYREQVDESLVRDILGTSGSEFLFRYCDAFAEQSPGKLFHYIDEIMKEGKDPAVFARDVCRHIRALIIAKTSPDDLRQVMDITGEEASDFIRQSERFTLTRLMTILERYLSLETEMRYTSTPRMALENTSLKCCLSMEQTDSQALNDRITELEKKLAEISRILEKGVPHSMPEMTEKKESPSKPAEKKQVSGQTVSLPSSTDQKSPGKADQAAWGKMMDAFKKREPLIWSFLLQGSVTGCENGHYYWQANQKDGEQLYILPLNKPDKRQKICECLSEITGTACDFTAVEKDRDPRPAENSGDDSYLNKLYETFGAESVEITDTLK